MPTALPPRHKGTRVGGKKIADRWWLARDNRVHSEVFATVEHIRAHSENRRRQDMHHMRLYGNLDVSGAGWTPIRTGIPGDDGRMRYNLCASAVDTAASVIAQQRPRPHYLTTEGDFGLQRQARLRTKVLEGQFYDLGVYEIMPEVFIDAAVLGTGVVYGYIDADGKPIVERVLPMEMLVDHQDGIARKPRSIYRRRLIPREVLADMYPEHERAIRDAAGPSTHDKTDFWLTNDTTVDNVIVVEAWHLPSGNAKDGKRVICVSGGTLVSEEYVDEDFPFIFYRWKTRQLGFWGAGIVEECRDAQVRINQLIKRITQLQTLGANAWILVDQNAGVRVEQITNQPLSMVIWNSKGAKPEFQSFNPTPPELHMEIQSIREQTFSQLGLSTMVAEGKKPAGLDSGAAQRIHDDLLSRRHVMNARGYEAAHMDLVKLLERLNEQADGLSVATRSSRGWSTMIKQVDWADVRLPENKYRTSMFPTSALPTTPSGKMATVVEWIDRGFVSRPFGISLLDFPDIDAAARLELADLDVVMADVERMLDGEAAYPEPFQDLEMAADVARRSYLAAKVNGAPDDVLELFRDYIEDCRQLVMQAAPPPPLPPDMTSMPAPTEPAPAALPVELGGMIQ